MTVIKGLTYPSHCISTGDVQCFGRDCYALAFGVPAVLMIIALGENLFCVPGIADMEDVWEE